MLIEIYRIDWEDGSSYVGHTRRGVKHRVWQHGDSRSFTNHAVFKKFQSGMPWTVTVLETHTDTTAVRARERELVLAQENPLQTHPTPVSYTHLTLPTIYSV